MLTVGFILVVIARWNRASGRLLWESCQHMHDEYVLEATVEGLRFQTSKYRTDLHWPGILRSAESDRVIVLFVGDSAFQIVPTRAFADAQALEAFRNLVQTMTISRASNVHLPLPPPLPHNGAGK